MCRRPYERFLNAFSPLIYVPIVQIWITCIKYRENAVNLLNIANETRKMENLYTQDFNGLCWTHKKIMLKQRRYVNYLSKFKRFPLETTKLHWRWFDLWILYIATIFKPSQLFTTALWSQIMGPCQVSTFFDFFYIFKNFDNNKVHF